jgi:hypothetical protein
MRGKRDKQALESARTVGNAIEIIDDRAVIKYLLCHLGLWEEEVRVHTGADLPTATAVEPWLSLPAAADR